MPKTDKGDIVGQKIKSIRAMTDAEMEREGWSTHHGGATVLELVNGTQLFPSSDEEGNDAGALFGLLSDGSSIFVLPPKEG